MACLAPPPSFVFPPLYCDNKMASEPPKYSPSAAVPSYSLAPGPSERILAATARTRRPVPTGVFTRNNSLIAIALRGQEGESAQPSYGRNGMICGDIGLTCTQGVQAISLKLEGRLHMAHSDGASIDFTFLSASSVAWKADSNTACPTMFPFEMVLPESFMDNGSRRALPPSYSTAHAGMSDIFVQCSYSMTVCVARKGGKLTPWKQTTKKLAVPFTYRPRLRPPQPILSSPFPFLSTIKTLPEEWFQVTSTMSAKCNSGLQPIDCHLFVPVVQTFSLKDTIPFYLQLIAPLKSLHAFMHPTTSAQTKLKRSKSHAADSAAPPTVRVYLMRQVTAVVRGQHSTRMCSIGEGTLRPVPPGVSPSPLRSQSLDEGFSTLDYEGEVRANADVTVGQFGISRLQIRDFISIYLAPPNQYSSPLNLLQHSHPIRLVTDSFEEAAGHDDGASQ
ncbi:hypothetical protein BC834DRAFT_864446 [Gloeopeniophorella convolvens]|nr:hypothetical protein BC834DRAFT_864446 [Gloeopeniophorella convolvens]